MKELVRLLKIIQMGLLQIIIRKNRRESKHLLKNKMFIRKYLSITKKFYQKIVYSFV